MIWSFMKAESGLQAFIRVCSFGICLRII